MTAHKGRLAYLVSRYPAVSHTFILREILGLRRLGWTVHVASVNPPDRTPDRMTPDEAEEARTTYCLKEHGAAGALAALVWALMHNARGLFRVLALAWSLGRGLRRLYSLTYAVEAFMVACWMDKHHHSHLHAHFGTVGSTVGVLVKAYNGCTLSVTIHGPDEFDDVPGQHLVLKMERADRVICISQFARSQLMRLSPPHCWPKMQVCRLGVDTQHFRPRGNVREPGPTRLLSVGRLAPAKGQLLMVQACAQLKEQGAAFELTVVGDGPDRQRLQRAVQDAGLSDCVAFTGALNTAEVHRQLQQADAFVLPSLAEGIPVVLMEAMASGVPCVTTPVNGIPELVRHDVNGLLATPGDVDALCTQLGRMVADGELRARLGQAARQTVCDHYDTHRNVEGLSQLLTSIEWRCAGAEPVLALRAEG
jgi:colanic acid/amylovoran biosynthesis glycosyltransferase